MKLQSEQIAQFFDKGYLVVENVFSPDDLAPVIAAYDKFIAQRAIELKTQGKIQDICDGLPFEKRFAAIYLDHVQIFGYSRNRLKTKRAVLMPSFSSITLRSVVEHTTAILFFCKVLKFYYTLSWRKN